MNFDDSFKYLLGVGAVALTSATGLLYKGTHARIKRVEDSVGKKADAEDLEHMRSAVRDLWTEMKDVRKDMNGGFESVRKDMGTIHVDIVSRLPRG